MAKILLIEDDLDLARTVVDGLNAEHHDVEAAHDGLDGMEMLKRSVYDVIILDWCLPGLAGIEVLKKFRAGGGQTPVIMLTGRAQISDKESGFDSGADDYLTKPFNIREVAVRIRALLRRPKELVSDTVQVGDIVLDPIKHTVMRAGKPAYLSPRDFALLEFLMRHPGEVFSVDSLLTRVWNLEDDATPDGLRASVRRIRKEIDTGDNLADSIIENIARVGYKLRV